MKIWIDGGGGGGGGGGVQWRTGKVKPQVFGGFKVDSFTNMTMCTLSPPPFSLQRLFCFPYIFMWFDLSRVYYYVVSRSVFSSLVLQT